MVYNRKINEDYLDDISQEEMIDRNDIKDNLDLKNRFQNCLSFNLFLTQRYDNAEELSRELCFFEKRCLRAVDNFSGIKTWEADGFFYLEK